MKALNTIRYLLFAVSLIGLFANFAQNEYGLDMLFYSNFFIALIFFVEAFVYPVREWKNGKLRALFIFTNHFFIACIFLGFFFRHMHWPGAGPLLAFPLLFLLMEFLIYAIRILVKESRKGFLLSIVCFLFVIVTTVALTGVIFKNMHWPGAGLMLIVSGICSLIFLPVIFLKIKYKYNGGLITLKERLAKFSGKTVLVFAYFGFWGIYTLCVSWGVLPGFYSLSRPPAVVKIEDRRDYERAEIYWGNYTSFIENRQNAQAE